jgi:hypothetical protein
MLLNLNKKKIIPHEEDINYGNEKYFFSISKKWGAKNRTHAIMEYISTLISN